MISSGVVEDTTATRGRLVEQRSLTITESSVRNARV